MVSKNVIFFRRFIFALSFLLIIFGLIYIFLFKKEPSVLLESNVVIQDHIRIEAQPTLIKKKNQLIFDIHIQSYEMPEWVNMDVLEAALLELPGQDPLLPTDWETLYHDTVTLHGKLTVDTIPKSFNSFSLLIFSLSEFRFTWTLKN